MLLPDVHQLPPFIVFTDLDGSLLDSSTYSWEPARPALAALQALQIPVILASSKTRVEIEALQREMHLHDPFITENGGAIYIPSDYFADMPPGARRRDGFHVLELGTPYTALRQALSEIAAELGTPLRGFRDMTIAEVAALTQLSPADAELAMEREYDEPFVIDASPPADRALEQAAHDRGLTVTRGGRFYHLLGGSDKGRACLHLLECYRRQRPRQAAHLGSVALGDSANDLSMLRVVDSPIVIPRPDGSSDPALRLSTATYAPAPGPEGWNLAILTLLETRGGNPGSAVSHARPDCRTQSPRS